MLGGDGEQRAVSRTVAGDDEACGASKCENGQHTAESGERWKPSSVKIRPGEKTRFRPENDGPRCVSLTRTAPALGTEIGRGRAQRLGP